MSTTSTAQFGRVDPKYGDLGALIYQNVVYVSKHPDRTLYEISEVYLKEIYWQEINTDERLTNTTTSDLQRKVTTTLTHSKTFGTEESLNASIGAEAKGVSASVGGELKEITSRHDETAKSQEIACTIRPGETLYQYVCTYKIYMRKWWATVHSGDDCVITEERGYEHTLCSLTEDEVTKGSRLSTTPLHGEEMLDVKPITKQMHDASGDGQYKRLKRSEVQWKLLPVLNLRWKVANRDLTNLFPDMVEAMKAETRD